MDHYTGRLLADRYRLPRTPADEFEFVESRAFDTASGQEVLVRQVPLPEVVDAETLDDDGYPGRPAGGRGAGADRATRVPDDPVVRRAVEAAAAAAGLPDHPRLDQVFDVFVQGDGLWIVSELLPARPLAAVLAEERLGPYRAAEVAADLLAALRIVHAHGWTHGNVTTRTVLICDDGRAVLTGLAAGAAEEVLCGYDPLPSPGVPETFVREPGPRPADPTETGELPRVSTGADWGTGALPQITQGAQLPHAHQPPQAPQPPQTFQTDQGPPGPGLAWAPEGAEAPGAPQDTPWPGNGGGQHVDPLAVSAPPPGFVREGPQSPGPEAYRRWQRGGNGEQPAADLVARMRSQGGQPPQGDGLPSSWDFEGGDAPTAAERAAAERAARSGAIAAYRAGTQAGAARRGGAPAELPGAGHPNQPAARSGWEPPPKPAHHSQQIPQVRLPQQHQEPRPQLAYAPHSAAAEAVERYRGPDSALAAERARQARIMTVGAVTERWAPEQAGPVYEHWRLAPPVGPAADFWALGALLFRVVQGHPPYPEESAAELAQAVCAEQPAFAEECGALRPVIESLLRQDPTERPRAEELRGWLRSLLRSAPEPEVGRGTATAPPPALEPGRPSDPRRLPILRRRGEIVGPRRRPRQRGQRSPRRLGRALISLVMLGLAGAVAYVLAFMSDEPDTRPASNEGNASEGRPEAEAPPAGEQDPADEPTAGESGQAADPDGEGDSEPSPAEGDQEPAPPPEGFGAVEDEAGFALAVPDGWQRQGPNGNAQIIYGDGDLEILVVAGRDGAEEFGDEPMDYQLNGQPELAAQRAYQYSTQSGLIETRVGNVRMADGVFGWREDGVDVLAYNRVLLVNGSYHIVMVRGPASERDRLAEISDVTSGSYRAGG
ncbi:serine/threonine protein kinase [Streptomyces hainanensis]|uniref:Serine/threonine protein kinase n=1 Tax=Streptomyces hainanensis TaxID=402648 RepID=A0A4R4TQX3_9ACTN|nr:serine/threonine protein kinase [Streptomyces hainanensis]TDC77782.1 serine/threonine protein kinase [Streptomyces hainanensis]